MPRTPSGCYPVVSLRLARRILGDDPRRDVRWIAAGPGMRCAEIGSGGGYYTPALAAHLGPGGLLVALDPAAHDPRAHRRPGPGATTVHVSGDGLALPFASGALDALLYSYSLEEMSDPAAALAEAARVLRPGGQLVLFLWRPVLRRGHVAALGGTDAFDLRRARRGGQNLRLAYRRR
ncbi:class I SAM-dependent methyltransferase [Streptomyces abikoensis]|uniref:class I SAM-dependent methyltransferase n=1 Tax=Streptomyces abikoensis TaxID=97398 RepID=UPI00371A8B1E